MARADLLLDLVRTGARGDHALSRKSLEALIAEERTKQHHILADRLAAHPNTDGAQNINENRPESGARVSDWHLPQDDFAPHGCLSAVPIATGPSYSLGCVSGGCS